MSPSFPPPRTYAGFQPEARRPAASPMVEHWSARGPAGPAELYLGPADVLARARSLPGHGPFPRITVGSDEDRTFVLVPGQLALDLEGLSQQLSPGAAAAFAWHIAAALAELHENGDAHGALHAGFAGLDADGALTLRPALAASSLSEPDPQASAQATDCLQLAVMFDLLGLDQVEEPAMALLLSGLRRERARLRLQPGRAVRQALAAILARHAAWDRELVEILGPGWSREIGRPAGQTAPKKTPIWRIEPEDREALPAPPRPREARPPAPATINLDAARAALVIETPPPRPIPPVAEEEDVEDDVTSPHDVLLGAEAELIEAPDPGQRPLDLEPDTELEPASSVNIRFAARSSALAAVEEEPTGSIRVATLVIPAIPEPAPPPAPAPIADPAEITPQRPPPPSDPPKARPTVEVSPRRAPPPPPALEVRPAPIRDAPAPRAAATPVRPAPISPPPRPPAPVEPARPAPPPAPSSERLGEDRDRGGPARWEGLSGVTGAESREAELGAGKWSEPARDLAVLREEMDTSPVREMELEPQQASWPLLLGVAVVAALLFGVWWLVPEQDPATAPAEPASAEEPAAEEAAALAPVEASPAAAVRVETEPAGLMLRFDGVELGPAPAMVPLPEDEGRHKLCAVKRDGSEVCRELDRDALLLTDPYRFAVR